MATNASSVRISQSTQQTSVKERLNPLAQVVGYWLVCASIYLTFGVLFYYSAKEKLIDDNGTMPAGLAHSYHGTFIASFPGTNGAWVIVGILEALVFLAIVASVLMGEFLPTRRKPVLLSGLGLSMLTFAVIAWGENITSQFSTVAELFQYLAGTAVLIVLILLMPPYRRARWLSGLGELAGDRPAQEGHTVDRGQEASK